jgi:hypothetical protein
MLIHGSITELEQLGYYERYRDAIDPASLARIRELIGPGSMPIDLALGHYKACDQLGLTDEQIYAVGLRAGERVGDALLVKSAQTGTSGSERSPWNIVLAFHRMSRRIYDGSSVQYVKLGPNTLLMEYKENHLFSVRYYRVAQAGFVRSAFSIVGVEIKDFKLSPYRPEHAEIEARMSWK